jgi:predicted dehydrogenase
MAAKRASDGSRTAPRLRVGVVGLGYWGPNLVRNFMESTLFDVAYLCDIRPEMLKEFEGRYPGTACTTRFEDVLCDSNVDAVAIATPVSTHYALVSSALAAGKHVFVEKPLARSAEEIVELTRQAEASDLVLMPGHTFLYSPPVRAIKRIIDSGELGDIYFISSSRVNLGPLRRDVDVVWDLGPHDFSILRYWLGGVPDEVSAISRSCLLPEHSDVCFVNLRYSSGIVAHVELSWLSPSKLRRTTVVGSKKMVVYDDTLNEPVRIFDSGVNMPDPKTFGEYQLSLRTGDIISPRMEPTEPLSLELADFGAAVRDGKRLVSSPEIGLDVVRTIEAVTESLKRNGVPVRMDAGASDELFDEVLRRRIEELEPGGNSNVEVETSNSDSSIGTAILGGGPAGLTLALLHI